MLKFAPHSDITGLIDEWLADVDGDEQLEAYQFTCLPLVVICEIGGNPLQLIYSW